MPYKIGTVELSDQDVAELREVFDLVDKDKGGSISAPEVAQLMQLLGVKTTMAEVEKMVADIDVDGSGEVDFDEFLQVMAGPQQMTYTQQELMRAFRMFQEEHDPPGHITPEKLEEALDMYASNKISSAEAANLVSQLDVNSDGYINFREKVNIFMSK